MKKKKSFNCQNCNFQTEKWFGKCPNCFSWNTLKEITISENLSLFVQNQEQKTTSFKEIALDNESLVNLKYEFSSKHLNSFWNQGLAIGSLTLLAGQPGLGKSTLSLQLIRSLLIKNKQLKVLYVSAEESAREVVLRSKRLDIPDSVLILQTNSYEKIENEISNLKPNIVIIDSIQTIFSDKFNFAPGSINQVSTIANNFLAISKKFQICILLIGHVTKEGQIAGPKTLEHIVDSVLTLENSDKNYRILSFSKHRYGTTENQLLLKMTSEGLQIITDPSLVILGEIEKGIGICYGLILEKNLPSVIEVQALVVNSGQAFGKREVQGISISRLNIIIGIIYKYLHIDLSKQDIFLQAIGNFNKITDFNSDLSILLAILSSYKNQTVNQLLGFDLNKTSVFTGRLTLSGQVRKPNNNDLRKKTADKLNFEYNLKIKFSEIINLFIF